MYSWGRNMPVFTLKSWMYHLIRNLHLSDPDLHSIIENKNKVYLSSLGYNY